MSRVQPSADRRFWAVLSARLHRDRPMDPAGAVDNAKNTLPTAPWTALTPRRPQAPQALRRLLSLRSNRVMMR